MTAGMWFAFFDKRTSRAVSSDDAARATIETISAMTPKTTGKSTGTNPILL